MSRGGLLTAMVEGVDVGKASLEVSVAEGSVARFENATVGLTRLLKHLSALDVGMAVRALTGGYERLLLDRGYVKGCVRTIRQRSTRCIDAGVRQRRMQDECPSIRRLLTTCVRPATLGRKHLGDPVLHQWIRNTFITSSPRWLMTFTAMRPDSGLLKGRDSALCRVFQAS